MVLKYTQKGDWDAMNEDVKLIKEYLSHSHNHLIVGLILVGLGGGLIASAFIFVNKK